MITVNGECTDYAIMKQVQQARLVRPDSKVLPLAKGTRFSTLAADEPLYIVSHGDRATGRLRNIRTADLLGWLTHRDLGLPAQFGGIVILSCYGGLSGTPAVPVSLAREVAVGIAGRAAVGTAVAGARGYSFGSPEFRRSGRSSVLSLDLDDFYWADDIPAMKTAWLAHKPTSTAGVLKDVFKCRSVDTDKTTEQNIRKALAAGGSATDRELDKRATELVTEFARKAKGIESRLKKILDRTPGATVAEKADYFTGNSDARDVLDWNSTIEEQFQLFEQHYLWTPARDAFQVEKTP